MPPAPTAKPLVGVLALQGGFEAHERILRGLGAGVREVRTAADLDGLHGLVIPGGESTTMTLGIEREGLREPLRELVTGGAGGAGVPVLGSCAGLIMLDSEHLGLMDMRAQRNAFGRQLRSFETDLDLTGSPEGRCGRYSSARRGSPSTVRTSRSWPRWTVIPWRRARATCWRWRSTPS